MIGAISCWQEQGAWVFLLLELGGFVCVMYATILTSELVLVLQVSESFLPIVDFSLYVNPTSWCLGL